MGWTGGPGVDGEGATLTPARDDTSGRHAPALEAVFRRDYARLVALARLLVDRPDEAEEIVQEAFVRAYAAGDRLEQRDEPRAYVQRSVVNLARDGLRRRATVRRNPVPAVGSADGADVDAILDEDQREIVAALRTLPDRQRACVALRYLLDLSTAETAAALEISTGSVKTHLSRGLAALHATLEDSR